MRILGYVLCLVLPLGGVARAAEMPPAARVAADLAVVLEAEGDHAGAALESGRVARLTPAADQRAAWHWAAGFEYLRAGEPARSEALLDAAEEETPADLLFPARLVRGETARLRRDWDNAAFYFGSAARDRAAPADLRAFAVRRAAAAELERGDQAAARAALAAHPEIELAEAQAVLARYAAGRDKRPRLGGALGLIPGLGYLYAGEPANALRSLILNGLFLFGMVHTAERDQWGAFAIITFFEITWYSGSIYGGLDASHRYNQARRVAAVEALDGSGRLEADYEALPAIRLNLRF
ncbi:MAG: hypothetical protein K9N49_05680 [Candidatus Marinimicrobia bacterium]|nr:hypothetical protein [Candidatus Neomarinimicrobiota bacterium]